MRHWWFINNISSCSSTHHLHHINPRLPPPLMLRMAHNPPPPPNTTSFSPSWFRGGRHRPDMKYPIASRLLRDVIVPELALGVSVFSCFESSHHIYHHISLEFSFEIIRDKKYQNRSLKGEKKTIRWHVNSKLLAKGYYQEFMYFTILVKWILGDACSSSLISYPCSWKTRHKELQLVLGTSTVFLLQKAGAPSISIRWKD